MTMVIQPNGETSTPQHRQSQRVKYYYNSFDLNSMKPALRKAAQALIGKSFIDEEEKATFQITGIKGRKNIPYFQYFNVHSYPQGPPHDEDHEYQPVTELLYKPQGQSTYRLRPPTKSQHYKFINSIFHSKSDQPLLSVNPKGGNLTFSSAAKGPDRQLWYQASDLEIRRLVNSKTIKAIHKEEQSHNRCCDTTYYSPQVKENSMQQVRRLGESEAPSGETKYTILDGPSQRLLTQSQYPSTNSHCSRIAGMA